MPTDKQPAGRQPSALDALFWRDEILQVLFWMQGEGLADAAGMADLRVFLTSDAETIAFYLEKMTAEGLLARHSSGDGAPAVPRYALTEAGRREAGHRFADAFEGMQMQGHGECSPDCICQWEGPAACPAHQHDHPHG